MDTIGLLTVNPARTAVRQSYPVLFHGSERNRNKYRSQSSGSKGVNSIAMTLPPLLSPHSELTTQLGQVFPSMH